MVVTVTKVAVVVMNRQQVIVVRCHVVHEIVQNQKQNIELVVVPDLDHKTEIEKTDDRNIHSNDDDTVAIEVVQDIVEAVIVAEIEVENEIVVHHHESIAVINQMIEDDTMIDRKN